MFFAATLFGSVLLITCLCAGLGALAYNAYSMQENRSGGQPDDEFHGPAEAVGSVLPDQAALELGHYWEDHYTGAALDFSRPAFYDDSAVNAKG